jgi:transcriptional regulator with XRE-family HTH domain
MARKVAGKPVFAAVGRRVREVRVELGLRQDDFAPILGITQGQLSKIERGFLPPSAEVLLRLRERSGRSVDWVLTGEDEDRSRKRG